METEPRHGPTCRGQEEKDPGGETGEEWARKLEGSQESAVFYKPREGYLKKK